MKRDGTVIYPNLEIKITERGMRKSAIAKKIGITSKAFTNKLNGITPFTWPQVRQIQQDFFPDCTIDSLFALKQGGDNQKAG